jgi:hypothetical protein
MKWLKAAALSLLALLLAGAAFLFKSLSARVEKAEAEARASRDSLRRVEDWKKRMDRAESESAAAKEKAKNERESLAATPDGGLLSRANKLF